ncbi:MAG: glycoside hydrolase family 5 protein, partial [bacterium]
MKHPTTISILFLLLIIASCKQPETEKFEVYRGTNISHWLSQSDRRGMERVEWFNEKDMDLIAEAGYDHIRLPVDEEQLWNEAG